MTEPPEKYDDDHAGSDFAEVVKAWHQATRSPVDESREAGFHAYPRLFAGRWTWILEHDGAVVEVADSVATLVADHPGARMHIESADPNELVPPPGT